MDIDYRPIEPPPGEIRHKGKRLELRIVRQPTAKGDVEKEIIVHPGAAVILPLLTGSRVVMIHNWRLAVRRRLWELPAGTLDAEEKPHVCAHRELKEETGYTAGEMEYLGQIISNGAWSTHRLFVFVARDLTAGEAELEPDEDIQVEVFEFTRIRRMIAVDEITDAKTLAAFAMYAARNGQLQLSLAGGEPNGPF